MKILTIPILLLLMAFPALSATFPPTTLTTNKVGNGTSGQLLQSLGGTSGIGWVNAVDNGSNNAVLAGLGILVTTNLAGGVTTYSISTNGQTTGSGSSFDITTLSNANGMVTMGTSFELTRKQMLLTNTFRAINSGRAPRILLMGDSIIDSDGDWWQQLWYAFYYGTTTNISVQRGCFQGNLGITYYATCSGAGFTFLSNGTNYWKTSGIISQPNTTASIWGGVNGGYVLSDTAQYSYFADASQGTMVIYVSTDNSTFTKVATVDQTAGKGGLTWTNITIPGVAAYNELKLSNSIAGSSVQCSYLYAGLINSANTNGLAIFDISAPGIDFTGYAAMNTNTTDTILTNTKPDLILINQLKSVDSRTNYPGIAAQFAAKAPNADVVIISGHQTGDASIETNILNNFNGQMVQALDCYISSTNNWGFIDLYHRIGTWSNIVAQGWTNLTTLGDTIHLGSKGQSAVGNWVMKDLGVPAMLAALPKNIAQIQTNTPQSGQFTVQFASSDAIFANDNPGTTVMYFHDSPVLGNGGTATYISSPSGVYVTTTPTSGIYQDINVKTVIAKGPGISIFNTGLSNATTSTFTGRITNENLGSSLIVGTDANKALTNIIVGDGLTFDGVTIKTNGQTTGGGGGGIANPLTSDLGLGGFNITGSGSFNGTGINLNAGNFTVDSGGVLNTIGKMTGSGGEDITGSFRLTGSMSVSGGITNNGTLTNAAFVANGGSVSNYGSVYGVNQTNTSTIQAALFVGNGAGITNITSIASTTTQTNFILGTIYRNTSGNIQLLTGDAALTVTGVSGRSSLTIMMDPLGGTAFAEGARSAIQSTALSVAMSYTNSMTCAVTTNATYFWTNDSTGAGDSALLTAGSGQVTMLGAAFAPSPNIAFSSPVNNTTVLTTSGDVTLTTTSSRFQLFTPDANRNCSLPASGAFIGDAFTIHVDGGTAFVVTLKTNGGTTVASLPDSTTVTVIWDGTNWLLL